MHNPAEKKHIFLNWVQKENAIHQMTLRLILLNKTSRQYVYYDELTNTDLAGRGKMRCVDSEQCYFPWRHRTGEVK